MKTEYVMVPVIPTLKIAGDMAKIFRVNFDLLSGFEQQCVLDEMTRLYRAVIQVAPEACHACGSDCNERDELIKAEREIERLSGMVAALKQSSPIPVDTAHTLADLLYDCGYDDARQGRDQDSRSSEQWQRVVDALTQPAPTVKDSLTAREQPAITPAARWRSTGEPDPHADSYGCERAALPLGEMTDDELANAVYLHGSSYPSRLQDAFAGKIKMPIVYLTAAKERIRWLSRKLEHSVNADEYIQTAKAGALFGHSGKYKYRVTDRSKQYAIHHTNDIEQARRYAAMCMRKWLQPEVRP